MKLPSNFDITKVLMKALDTINKLPPASKTTVLLTVTIGTFSLMHPWSDLLLRTFS